MGCFNVSCALSGLTIRAGDPCYFIPLIPDSFHYESAQGEKVFIGADTLICSNEGSLALYNVALLPLLGEYNDYGCLENPQSPANIKAIERIVGVDIETFLGSPSEQQMMSTVFIYDKDGESRWEKRPVHFSGCFVHKFAYDIATKHMLKTSTSFLMQFPVGNKLLEYIGLGAPLDDKSINERYHYLYRVKGEDNFAIQSDEDFSHIAKKENGIWKEAELILSLSHLSKQWKKLTGKTLDFPKGISKRNIFDLTFDNARDKFRQIDELEKINKEDANVEDSVKAIRAMLAMTKLSFRASRNSGLFDDYRPEVVEDNPEIRKLMGELHNLISYMYLNNRLFMPTLSGPQGGDLKAEMTLVKASEAYIKRKEKQYSDY